MKFYFFAQDDHAEYVEEEQERSGEGHHDKGLGWVDEGKERERDGGVEIVENGPPFEGEEFCAFYADDEVGEDRGVAEEE